MKTTQHKLVKITKVKPKGYVLVCEFGDGTTVEYDMASVKSETGEMIEPLKDPKFFAKVFLDRGVLTWPNGFDVCPNTVYQDGKRLGRTKVS